MEFYHHLPSWAMNEQISYFSSFSDEWSRDLKSVQVQKQRSCREAKELLEVITAERLETEQQQKLEQQEQLSIEKLRLEIELSRNTNQSATQNNGQTSRVKSLDEIVKMAKRNSDETFSQFASLLTSMWLYYCKLRDANDFESVNQLIVADKMFETFDSETATHIGVLQREEWYKPRDLGKQCDIFYASKGKSYDEPERAKWNDSEKRSFNGSGGKQPFGEKKSHNFSSRKNFDKGQVEGASTIYLKGIFGPAVKCPLVYVPIGLATGCQANVVHQQVLCALAEVLVEDVLLPPEVLDMLGGAQSEENSLAQSSQDLRVDSGNVDETEVSSGILPERESTGAY
ncbi:CCHC-type domain-containing protein [Trichonephila clavipes]|nr:CCHC-type domain-containing protein [Trichonephila clavipes]